jgi:hypothetical protein
MYSLTYTFTNLKNYKMKRLLLKLMIYTLVMGGISFQVIAQAPLEYSNTSTDYHVLYGIVPALNSNAEKPTLKPFAYNRKKKSFKKVTKLDEAVNETSGLIYDQGFIWTHNDSGGEAALYKINPKTGKVIQKVMVKNAKNTDWEDLAQDKDYIYIGDFGNNSGYRKDLKIYKIAKKDIQENTTEVDAQTIDFSYPDQTDFTKGNNHNFDCEAFFVYNGQLHLFSKNRNDKKTKHYALPTTAGTHQAVWIEEMNAQGLVTAADMDASGNVVLIGYTPQNLFMWICWNHTDGKFFSANTRRIEMGKFFFRGQLEGVCFAEQGKGYISSERFKIIKPHLRYFDVRKWLEAEGNN